MIGLLIIVAVGEDSASVFDYGFGVNRSCNGSAAVNFSHDFVASAVVDGLMQVGLETEVPVLSVSLTPHNYQETEHHNEIYRAHFVEKGREAARAALGVTKSLELVA